jgi:type VI secretion system protein ImpF
MLGAAVRSQVFDMMAITNRNNRLSPPLMHAFRSAHIAKDAKKKLDLRDEAGERVLAGRRLNARVAITELTLRREVARDLESLMNTIAMESSEDLEPFDAIRKSILNYGFPDVAHRTIDELRVDDIRGEIQSVLVRYEPRLLADTIRISRDDSISPDELKIRFLVNAHLHCEPLNVPIEFVAEVDVDSAQIMISRL